jgi:hypothetical protein
MHKCSHLISRRFILRHYTYYIMAIPVMEFSREGYKIRKVFGLKLTAVK